MLMKSLSGKPQAESTDLLAEKIRDSILGIENLRGENLKMTDQINSLETANLRLEAEVRSLTYTLEQERSERQHYHSFANEIISQLGVVGQTITDVVKRAELESHRLQKEGPRADLPLPELPASLKKVDALYQPSQVASSDRRSQPSSATRNDELDFADVMQNPPRDGET